MWPSPTAPPPSGCSVTYSTSKVNSSTGFTVYEDLDFANTHTDGVAWGKSVSGSI